MEELSNRKDNKKSLVAVGVVFLIIAAVRVGSSYLLGWLVDKGFLNSYAMRLLVNQLVLASPVLIYLAITHSNPFKVLHFHKIKISTAVLLVVMTYVVVPLLGFLNSLSMLFTKNVVQETLQSTVSDGSLVVAVGIIAVMPAIFEEVVYRGFFFHQYKKVNIGVAALVSALLFGLMHLNLNQFIYAFALGFLLALVNEATGSVVSSMIVHFIINANSTIMMYLLPKLMKVLEELSGEVGGVSFEEQVGEQLSSSQDMLPVVAFYGAISIVSVVLVVIILKTIAKKEGHYEELKTMFRKRQTAEGERIFSIPLILGILACAAIMIWLQIKMM